MNTAQRSLGSTVATRYGDSFYITGGTLPGTAACYVERAADLEILRLILAREYVYVLDARQMGKSSLCIRTLQKLADAGVRTAFVDLTKFGGQNLTPDQWFLAMLREIGRDLDIAKELAAHWKENTDVSPMRRFFGAVQEVALTAIPGHVAIFVDEIDVTRTLPFKTDEFFAGIRQCFTGRATDPRLERLTFSLIGTATPAELIEDTRVSPFNIGSRIELEDFRYEEATILAKSLPGDSEAILRRILYWTGGHPYLTQRLCQAIAKDASTTVDAACRSLFFRREVKDNDDNLAFVRNRLLKNDLDLASLLELYGRVQAGKPVLDEATNPLCAVLRMSGLTRVVNGHLKVRNLIYAKVFDKDWVKRHLPDAESRRQRLAYRRGLLRATAICAAGAAVVAGLAIYGFSQAHIARAALDSAKRLSSGLRDSEQNLRTSLTRTKNALALADQRRVAAEKAILQAKGSALAATSSAAQAALQRQRADAAANAARAAAQKELSARQLADSRLRSSLVARGTQLLDGDDPSGALEPLGAALQIDTNDPARERVNGIRLAYALHDASTLRQVWSGAGPMLHAEFLPDGKRVLTANSDGSIRVWNSVSGAPSTPRMAHPGLICIAVARDGRHALSGGSHGDVRWWDLTTGKQLRSLSGSSSVQCVGISEDGLRAAIAYTMKDWKTNFCIWDTANGQVLQRPDPAEGNAFVDELVFSPNGRRLVVGCENYLAWSLDVGDGAGDHPISGCYTASEAVFLSDGKSLLINGADTNSPEGFRQGAVLVCDENGKAKLRYRVAVPQDGHGKAFRISRDGLSLIVATSTGTLQLYDLASGQPRGLTVRTGTEIFDCDLSPDGKVVSTAGADGGVRTWSLESGKLLGSILWHGSTVTKVRFDATGKRLLTCCNDGTARVWELISSGFRQIVAGPELVGYTPVVAWGSSKCLISATPQAIHTWDEGLGWRTVLPGYHVEFAADRIIDGARQIVVDGDVVRVYDFRQKRFLTPPLTSQGNLHRVDECFGLSPDDKYFFDEYAPGRLRVLDLDRGAHVVAIIRPPYRLKPTFFKAIPPKKEGTGQGCALVTSANRVVTGGEKGEIDIWSLQSGAHVATAQTPVPASEFRLSGDGQVLVTRASQGSQFVLKGFHISDGHPMGGRIPVGYPDWQGTISRDGSRIAIPGSGLWDLNSGRVVDLLVPGKPASPGHLSFVRVSSGHPAAELPAWNRDYTIVLSTAAGTLHSMETGKSLTGPIVRARPFNWTFSDDGRYVAFSEGVDAVVCDLTHNYKLLGPIYTGSPSFVGFLPNSSILWTNTSHSLRFWDPLTSEEILPPTPAGHFAPKFSPGGKWFEMEIDGNVVLCAMPQPPATKARLQKCAEAISEHQLRQMNARRFATLRAQFPELFTYK